MHSSQSKQRSKNRVSNTPVEIEPSSSSTPAHVENGSKCSGSSSSHSSNEQLAAISRLSSNSTSGLVPPPPPPPFQSSSQHGNLVLPNKILEVLRKDSMPKASTSSVPANARSSRKRHIDNAAERSESASAEPCEMDTISPAEKIRKVGGVEKDAENRSPPVAITPVKQEPIDETDDNTPIDMLRQLLHHSSSNSGDLQHSGSSSASASLKPESGSASDAPVPPPPPMPQSRSSTGSLRIPPQLRHLGLGLLTKQVSSSAIPTTVARQLLNAQSHELKRESGESGALEWLECKSSADAKQSGSSSSNHSLQYMLQHGLLKLATEGQLQAFVRSLQVFLKLPRSLFWLSCEYFYSDMERALLLHENDFVQCLEARFPELRTRHLRLGDWRRVRALLGRPRRCSPAFFDQERVQLERKRQQMRLVQQRRYDELRTLDGLPELIPPAFSVGARVTAGVCTPGEQSNKLQTPIQLSSLRTMRPRQPQQSKMALLSALHASFLKSATGTVADAAPSAPGLLPLNADLSSPLKPPYFLRVGMAKILQSKKEALGELRELSSEFERKRSFHEPITFEFQKEYAAVVLELEYLNRDLNEYLESINVYCQQLARGQVGGVAEGVRFDLTLQQIDHSLDLRHWCSEAAERVLEHTSSALSGEFLARVDAASAALRAPTQAAPRQAAPEAVAQSQSAAGPTTSSAINAASAPAGDEQQQLQVQLHAAMRSLDTLTQLAKSERLQRLIARLTSLLMQLRVYADSELTLKEADLALKDSLREIRESLDPSNYSAFDNNVEVHVQHLHSMINQFSALFAFHRSLQQVATPVLTLPSASASTQPSAVHN